MKYNTLAWWAFFSLVLILLMIFFPFIPELKGTGEQLNGVFISLLLAYIGSFIFYSLVVHYKEKKITPLIASLMENLNEKTNLLFTFLKDQLKIPLNNGSDKKLISNKQIDNLFLTIDENLKKLKKEERNDYIKQIAQPLREKTENIDRVIKEILSHSVYLKAELIIALSNIKHSNFHDSLLNIQNYTNQGERFIKLKSELIEYINLVEKMKTEANKA